ncbi:MAG: metal ABC transporter permease [Flavobacteriales bacterium]
MELFNSNFWWIFFTAIFIAVPSALLGCFLILRKMAMIGDAISHAVLPGIVVAYLFTHSYNSFPMLIAAAAVGVFCTFLIETFNKVGRLQEDASIGVTYTWLFAIGVVMISFFNDNLDLDQDCVLFGEIAYVPLNAIEMLQDFYVPIAFLTGFGMMTIVILVIIFFYNGFKITSFDPLYAASIGISLSVINYTLMSLVSFVTVFSFESVGAILVLAFMVVPPATAYLLTHQLKRMMLLSCLFAIHGVFWGYLLSVQMNSSIAGAMATCLGIQFFVVFALHLFKKNKKVMAS